MLNDRSKPWEHRKANGRITAVRARRRVLILCEDEKSACLYFKGFKLDKRRGEVLTRGTGMNTDSLVQEAIAMKERAVRCGEPLNEIWCVFDRDSFPARNFNRALQLAESKNISVAWANEAFEIWYLLHFHYHDTGVNRAEYAGRLTPLLVCKYDKADDQIYARLESRQPTAMKHARRLEKHGVEMGSRWTPENSNPSTNIHKLVEFLNDFAEIGPADTD
jgi:hypothetical protein